MTPLTLQSSPRRQIIASSLVALTGLSSLTPSARALPAKLLTFPRDRGAHPDFRTEWWYITGQAKSASRQFGFQLTFFRTRVEGTQAMQSKFAAKQLMYHHSVLKSG